MAKDHCPIVPVYMFHSITDRSSKTPYGRLSTPIETFEGMLLYLLRHKFNTITLDTLYRYLSTGEPRPPKSIVITFDDGYLDNWVNAFPILKKYGMKATIFVVPEFVDPVVDIRPTLLDVWQRKVHVAELSGVGFLSWNEMREMEHSGLIDIQSHSLSHTNHFQGDEIIDFHRPGGRYPWLAWNRRPDHKHLWAHENQEEFVEFGVPIYTHGRALAAPQYFPDASLAEILAEYVKEHGGRNFFSHHQWRELLFRVVRDYLQRNSLNARYESQTEYEARVERELLLSKEMIERALDKTVHFLCWPGGAFNQTTLRVAEKVGYLATTKGTSKNRWGADPGRIDRIGGRVGLTRNHPLVDRYVSPWVFAAQVEAYRGNRMYSSMLRWSLRTVRACRRVLRHRQDSNQIGG
jgi:peptidoglycan/xylan/chitin deacetylase (PgdA/CDA1 family)